MTDFSTEIVDALSDILPTVYEMFLDTSTPVPCISYQKTSDSEQLCGTTIGYSTVTYRIKLWAKSVKDIIDYSEDIDDKMAALDFKRIACNELTDSNLICRILDYNGLALETYNAARHNNTEDI